MMRMQRSGPESWLDLAIAHDGSMVLEDLPIIYPKNHPVMYVNIPAPWILWDTFIADVFGVVRLNC